MNAPHGSFTLHNNKNIPAVYLTGGIGMTPVRSIVLQAAKEKMPHKIFSMVYGMQKMLNDAGVDNDNIRIEEFPGY